MININTFKNDTPQELLIEKNIKFVIFAWHTQVVVDPHMKYIMYVLPHSYIHTYSSCSIGKKTMNIHIFTFFAIHTTVANDAFAYVCVDFICTVATVLTWISGAVVHVYEDSRHISIRTNTFCMIFGNIFID